MLSINKIRTGLVYSHLLESSYSLNLSRILLRSQQVQVRNIKLYENQSRKLFYINGDTIQDFRNNNNIDKFKYAQYELYRQMSYNRANLQSKSNSSSLTINRSVSYLHETFRNFEEKCKQREFVGNMDFEILFSMVKNVTSILIQNNQFTSEHKELLSKESLILIRCCGRLMISCLPEKREKLAEDVIQFIKSSNIPTNTSHYNFYMRTMNDNGTNFDPAEMLNEMKMQKLEIDRVTYHQVIRQYCLRGMLDEATSILELMQADEYQIDSIVLEYLIVGYCRQTKNPDLDEIYHMIEQTNLDPTLEMRLVALTELCKLLDEHPNLENSIRELINVLKQDHMPNIFDIFDLISTYLKLKDKYTFIDSAYRELLWMLGEHESSLKKGMLYLSVIGEHEESTKLLWAAHDAKKIKLAPMIQLYLHSLCISPKSTTPYVINECQALIEAGIEPKPYHKLYYGATQQGRLDIIEASIKKIKEFESIKIEYFWPLFAQSKTKAECIKYLQDPELKSFYDTMLTETFHRWIWKFFIDNPRELFVINEKKLGFHPEVLHRSLESYRDECIKRGQRQERYTN